MFYRQSFVNIFLCTILLAALSCSKDPEPRRLIKSVGSQTFTYDENSNLIEIGRDNITASSYSYDSDQKLVLAQSYSGYRDSTTFQYSGSILKSSMRYQFEGNTDGQLVMTIKSDYTFEGELLTQKKDLITDQYLDSTINRTATFNYQEGILISKTEIYSDDTRVETTFEFDRNPNPMSWIFGKSTFYHSPQLIEIGKYNDASNWPSLFQSSHNLTQVKYSRDRGCFYGEDGSGSGEISLIFEYDNQSLPTFLSRGTFDGCVGIGPDVLNFQIAYY